MANVVMAMGNIHNIRGEYMEGDTQIWENVGGCEREGVRVYVIVYISGHDRGWRVGHPGRGNLCEYLGICKGWRMWKHAC